MPAKDLTKAVSAAAPQELLDLIPRMRLLPGEDEAAFEGLRQALLFELAPSTPYETAIAENIIALEWELHRHRGLRDNLIRSSFRKVAQATRQNGKVGLHGDIWFESVEFGGFADALMNPTSAAAAAERGWLAERNIDIGELVAEAYQRVSSSLEPHERKLAELETRRRRLCADYDLIHRARAGPIADAELVETE